MTSFTVLAQSPAKGRVTERLRGFVFIAASSDAVIHFAMAVLHNANNTIEAHLEGDVLAMGYLLAGCPGVMVFVFGNLAISYPGLYKIRVDIYEVTDEGATLAHQVQTDTISVSNSQAMFGPYKLALYFFSHTSNAVSIQLRLDKPGISHTSSPVIYPWP
jgi:hypothetical protein